MSGTSLDGIDVAIVQFDKTNVELVSFYSTEFSDELRGLLMEVATAHAVEMDTVVRTHFVLAERYAQAVVGALDAAALAKESIRAIGLHGQTVRHLPGSPHPATLQLGSGAALAALTEIDVVSDFRSADLALGGQGAPLVPMFDYHFLQSDSVDRLIVNIGGIANVTWLPRTAREADVIAFDTGPGNILLDWISQDYYQEDFDLGGRHASNGTINEALLIDLLSNPYFEHRPPKSTGRELFSESKFDHIRQLIASRQMAPKDVLATLTELTARSIVQSLKLIGAISAPVEIIVSGGGALNGFLMQRSGCLCGRARECGGILRGMGSLRKRRKRSHSHFLPRRLSKTFPSTSLQQPARDGAPRWEAYPSGVPSIEYRVIGRG